ncbi:hypothetical protein GEW_08732 [Pasteurella multocida subsp. gallicida str. Anand1_poultry]|nr:hypothetical protein AAUPMG_08472 [Pasteurella multocida subsp. multocida str. Anand1_goat]EGP05111.1 hypothetical protein GEW_08732 [Pasteurella multocida subsp. gallicida str. Anand1_poultry]
MLYSRKMMKLSEAIGHHLNKLSDKISLSQRERKEID